MAKLISRRGACSKRRRRKPARRMPAVTVPRHPSSRCQRRNAQHHAGKHHDDHKGHQRGHQPSVTGSAAPTRRCRSAHWSRGAVVALSNGRAERSTGLDQFIQIGAAHPFDDLQQHHVARLTGIDGQHAWLTLGRFEGGELAVDQGDRQTGRAPTRCTACRNRWPDGRSAIPGQHCARAHDSCA